jgi:hypothetical protein
LIRLNKNTRKPTFIILIVLGFILPILAYAALVPCGTSENPQKCTFCDIFRMIQTIMNYIWWALLIIAPLFIIAGGVTILTAGAKPSNLEKGKQIITGTVVGLAIAFLSWTILNIVFITLAKSPGQEGFPWPWNEIRCTGGGVSDDTWTQTPNTCNSDSDCSTSPCTWCDIYGTHRCVAVTDLVCEFREDCPTGYDCGANGRCTNIGNTVCCCDSISGDNYCIYSPICRGNPADCPSLCNSACMGYFGAQQLAASCCLESPGKCPSVVSGSCSGTSCPDTSINFCGPIQDNCNISQVNNWNTQIQAAASGRTICSEVNTVRMVKAIMARESGGNINSVSPAGAAGLMQLLPDTANWRKTGYFQCAPNDNIDQAWLTNPVNAEKSICIAIEYMRHLADLCGCDVRQIAAGYNGGSELLGACSQSTNCGPAGTNCLACQNETFTRRWECLWDDNAHTVCNTGFSETRNYAPRVLHCYNQF